MTQAPKTPKPDEIKKNFWEYRRVQLGFILALVIGSYVLPKIPLLRGWENKFTAATVEISKTDMPRNATRIKSGEEALTLYPTTNPRLAEYLNLKGPLPLASWSCNVLGQKALCARYLWKNDYLTLVVTAAPKKVRRKPGPFTKSGLAGYYFVSTEKDLAFATVGPFEPDEIYKTLNIPRIPAATPQPSSSP